MKIFLLNEILTQHPLLSASVMTIGNFDGVHLGHQAMISQLQALAQQQNLKTAVMIFEPQPLELFAADKAPARLTRLREKAALSG